MNEIKRLINIAIEAKLDAVIRYRESDGKESTCRLTDVGKPIKGGATQIEGLCLNRQERLIYKIDQIHQIQLYNPGATTPVPNMSATRNSQTPDQYLTKDYQINLNKSRFNL